MYSALADIGSGPGAFSNIVAAAPIERVCVEMDCTDNRWGLVASFSGAAILVSWNELGLAGLLLGDDASRCLSIRLDTRLSISDLLSSADLAGEVPYFTSQYSRRLGQSLVPIRQN